MHNLEEEWGSEENEYYTHFREHSTQHLFIKKLNWSITFALYYLLMSDWLVTVMMKFIFHSDTGTKVPESCVFGQLLNMASAICKIVNLYIRINPI